MPQSIAEKKDRFARVAVPRIQQAVDIFRKIGNCSNPHQYAWDQVTLKKVFVHILNAIQECAKEFGMKIEFTIDQVDSRDLYNPEAIKEFLNE